MSKGHLQHVYGPVPSWRLGRSLGVDIVPFKTCTYDCLYCQLGRTTSKTTERKEYVAIDAVLAELESRLADIPSPDYISVAGSGEPTLSSRIGDLIGGIKALTKIPVAVLTNGSLLWMPEVRDALQQADLVLPSLDAGDEDLFCRVNRPCDGIRFEVVVNGLIEFTREFRGAVWLEVFLLDGITGISSEVDKIAACAARIGPSRIQVNTVSRPPAEEAALPVASGKMRELAKLFSGEVDLAAADGIPNLTEVTIHITDEEIMALLGRRPCTLQGISSGLRLSSVETMKRLAQLAKQGLVKTKHLTDDTYYVRNTTNNHLAH